jgi:carbohydrate ABC transporter substrate-binding protein, CUT1 family (TC 3.A.1.1.-)
MTEYGNALNVFASDLDVDAVVQALQDAAKDLK